MDLQLFTNWNQLQWFTGSRMTSPAVDLHCYPKDFFRPEQILNPRTENIDKTMTMIVELPVIELQQ